MIVCLQAVLLCLDRKLRLTFILGHVFETNSVDGAQMLDITPVAFRKRLSRASEFVRDFMKKKCVPSTRKIRAAPLDRSRLRRREA